VFLNSDKISIPFELDKLFEVRNFSHELLKQALFLSDKDRYQLVLAIDELCANRIIHSRNASPSSQLFISIQINAMEVDIEVKDDAEFFNLLDIRQPALQELVQSKRKGGLGINIIKSSLDKIQVQQEGAFTVHRLTKTAPATL
jgi:serine/threonine-protein kinase RsbW